MPGAGNVKSLRNELHLAAEAQRALSKKCVLILAKYR
jgi:hypothetical protein